MYETDVAMTGLGALVIGSVVIDLWWVAAILLGVGGVLLLATRLRRRTSAR